MVATGHTAVGVIIGITAYQFLGRGDLASGLVITGTLATAFHYLTDFIPHGHFFMPKDFKKYIKPVIIFDVLLPAVLFLSAIYLQSGLGEKFLYILFGIGGSQLPDVIDGLLALRKTKVTGLLKDENNFHQTLHWHGQGSKTLLLGLRDIWQVLLVIAAIFLVIFE